MTDQQLIQFRNQIHQILEEEIEKIVQSKTTSIRYLNKKEMCQYLKISNNTLDLWIIKGLPIITIGRVIRFDRFAVEKWVTGRETRC